MLLIVFSYLCGVLAILFPCILPFLPFLFAGLALKRQPKSMRKVLVANLAEGDRRGVYHGVTLST